MAAPGGAAGSPSKPLSVEQIVKQAQNYDYNPQIPLRYWLRSANTLIKEAEIYESEGNDQQTYLLLFRHAQLVLGQLTQHPDAGPAHRTALAQAERDVKTGLAKMEVLKPRITARYERYQKLLRERTAAQTVRAGDLATTQYTSSHSALDAAYQQQRQPHGQVPSRGPVPDSNGYGTETLAAGENKDLAVELARKEIRRRAARRKASLRAGVSEQEEHERRTAGVWGNWDTKYTQEAPAEEGDNLSRQMQNIRLRVDEKERDRRDPSRQSRPTHSRSGSAYNYPSIHPSKGVSSPDRSYSPRRGSGAWDQGFVSSLDPPPPPPPKDALWSSVPPRPSKEPAFGATSPAAPQPPPRPPQPSSPAPSKDLQPSGFTFKPSAYLENGQPLRTVFLPPDLRLRFLERASSNTRANLETCGILCGTLISNALFVSRLVIPEQVSTSDTCETKNEEDLFDYVDREDLMVLGWIHTHPTQTCFMSSRDLHTHSGYQAMMPESIAIVCAPSRPDGQSWGVFRLTDPPGLQAVLKCRQTGLFHPHEEKHMYTEALRPGHVFEAKGLEYEIHDMRKD